MQDIILGFIDIETTGHDPVMPVKVGKSVYLRLWHEIIDFACVFARAPGLEIVGEYSVKVKPLYPERCIPDLINHYPARAAQGEWKDALDLDEALLSFFRACEIVTGGGIIVPGGQNWFFDWSFISVAMAHLGMDEKVWKKYLSYKKFDTGSMALQALWDPASTLDLSDYSIRSGKLQSALGIVPEPLPHTALNGARQAFEVFKNLNSLGGKNG